MAIGNKKPVVMESDRAVPGGVATLGEDGKLAESQRPDVDSTPTEDSINPITSGGVYDVLSKKQPTLTGAPGQLIGIGGDGTAQATVYPSNKSLLHNWYLVDPINQRGEVFYPKLSNNASPAYCIDRWLYGRGLDGVNLTADGVVIKFVSSDFAFIGQRLEEAVLEKLANKTVTLAILVKGSGTGLIGNVNESAVTGVKFTVNSNDRYELISTTYKWPQKKDNWNQIPALTLTGGTVTVLAAKLELGPVQTLAHKEGDKWVLNDPPPNYALELAKCQRYQIFLNTFKSEYARFGIGLGQSDSVATIIIPLPTTLRAIPAISFGGAVEMFDGGMFSYYKIGNISYDQLTDNCLSVKVEISDDRKLTANATYILLSHNDAKSYILLDANL